LDLFEIMNMKKLKKGQWGFTLLELVIVIGLTGLIAGGLTLTIMRVFNMDALTRDDMIAVYQVRQAGKLVSQDVLEAQNVTAGGSSGFPLTLNWTVNNDKYGVVYTLEGTGALRILQRKYYFKSALNSTTKVAEYIAFNQTNCAPLGVLLTGNALTFKVTATVGGQSETRTYQVKPRPGS
jgi:prepilin-type N-terminal cleavage/methylation domain-containing protein